MAKKKEFEWERTQQIGEVEINESKKVGIAFNSLSIEREGEEEEERWYVSLTTEQHYKKKGAEEKSWNITKNATFPMDKFIEISEMVMMHLADDDEE